MKYVSGIRPTGRIHLGNYLGAIKQWRKQGGVYFVADLHADGDAYLTLSQLSRLGIDACIESDHQNKIFDIQHELSKFVGIGRLERMTQYKDKRLTEHATLSLLAYPVLMAADIFYFGGTHIPVGSDQVQHIEFARDMADIMKHYGYDFVKPEVVLSEYPRIMSLSDGTRKMSKSGENPDGCIYVDDTPDEIRRKIKIAKTAMNVDADTPEMNNLRCIHKSVGGSGIIMNFKHFKEELAEIIIEEFAV